MSLQDQLTSALREPLLDIVGKYPTTNAGLDAMARDLAEHLAKIPGLCIIGETTFIANADYPDELRG